MAGIREAAGAPFGAKHKSRVAHPLQEHRKGWAYHGSRPRRILYATYCRANLHRRQPTWRDAISDKIPSYPHLEMPTLAKKRKDGPPRFIKQRTRSKGWPPAESEFPISLFGECSPLAPESSFKKPHDGPGARRAARSKWSRHELPAARYWIRAIPSEGRS